jgi:hypothetical protein
MAQVQTDPPGESQLLLELVGADGQPLLTSRCELLLSSWYGTRRVELYVERNLLVIPLDEAWIRRRRKTGPRWESGRVLIRAPGHAAICSDSFQWIGAPGPDSTSLERTLIRFPRDLEFDVARGESRRGNLNLRRPQPRAVRVVDADGSPVADMRVAIHLFWSNENHCGALSGYEQLGQGTSDENGRVVVPDGQFEYAFQFREHEWILDPPEETYAPMRWIGRLESETTTIRFRRKVYAPLTLRVTRGDAPVVDLGIYANLAYAGCGATWGMLATTDRDGQIMVEAFWYEGHDRIWVEDKARKVLWSTDPRELDPTRVIEAKLPFRSPEPISTD